MGFPNSSVGKESTCNAGDPGSTPGGTQHCKAVMHVCVLVIQPCPSVCDPWTITSQAPLSLEFSRQEHWSALPFPSPGDLPNPGTEPVSPAFQADS